MFAKEIHWNVNLNIYIYIIESCSAHGILDPQSILQGGFDGEKMGTTWVNKV